MFFGNKKTKELMERLESLETKVDELLRRGTMAGRFEAYLEDAEYAEETRRLSDDGRHAIWKDYVTTRLASK